MQEQYDVVIVGAGAAGLTLAHCLGKRDINTLIIEQNLSADQTPKAIGISPPSLWVLRHIDLAPRFVEEGVPVKSVQIKVQDKEAGQLDFTGTGYPWDFVLSLPQNKTHALLEESLSRWQKVDLARGWRFVDFRQGPAYLILDLVNDQGETRQIRAAYLAACDGAKSPVREKSRIPFLGGSYSETFLMGDFPDTTGWGFDAHVYFTSRGSMESFPLPGGMRRFVLSTPHFIKEGSGDFLKQEIPLRAGISVEGMVWESGFGVQRFLAKEFYSDRVILCGDAAHVMSPIVGQNMNCGIADAAVASWCLERAVYQPGARSKLFDAYSQARKASAKEASQRAEDMMKKGVQKGALRDLMIKTAVKFGAGGLKGIFSMSSLPGARFDVVIEDIFRRCP